MRDLNSLTQNQITELVGLADALNTRLKEFGVTQYVTILGVEVNRGGKCFLSDTERERQEEYDDGER